MVRRIDRLRSFGIRRAIFYGLSNAAYRARGIIYPIVLGGIEAGKGLRIGMGVEITVRKLVLGNSVTIGPNVVLGNVGRIEIGSETVINRSTTIDSALAIIIGTNTLIAPNCYLVDSNHAKPVVGENLASAHVVAQRILIGSNVWIGQGVTVLPGVEIGDFATVGAGAVVTKNVPSGATVVGVPARPLSIHGSSC